MSAPAAHCNRLPFEGVLTLVDVPSDKAPSGARGHRVILLRSAAEAAMPTLTGMGVCFSAWWDRHQVRQKAGVIDHAEIVGLELRVRGYLFARDFPDVVARAKLNKPGDALGMSFEMAQAHVVDMRAEIYTVFRLTFTGAAILLREKAAYRKTRFRLLSGPATEACSSGH